MTRSQKAEFCSNLEGMSEAEAKEEIADNGFDARVERRDGEFLPGTMDYRDDRVNLFIESNEITHAEFG
jgi:hypothetical protein